MKKSLLALLIILTGITSSYATHLMRVETTCTYANNYTIERVQHATVISGFTLTSTQSNTNICAGDIVNFVTSTSISESYTYS